MVLCICYDLFHLLHSLQGQQVDGHKGGMPLQYVTTTFPVRHKLGLLLASGKLGKEGDAEDCTGQD